MIIECPKPASLTAIPAVGCGMRFDQVVKMGIQRVQATPSFNGTDLITTESVWDDLVAETDDTKMIITPFFAEFVIPPSENAEEGGGDNTTVNGLPINLGEQPVKVTGVFRNLPSAVKAALDKLAGESLASYGTAQIWVYLFNKDGKIISKGDSGIPIFNFRVSTPGSEGYNQDNKNNFSFNLAADWDTSVVMTTPLFNPLTAL